MFEYMIVNSKSHGYCVMKKCNGFWQQITKWYWYYGNSKRFNEFAKYAKYYKIID